MADVDVSDILAEHQAVLEAEREAAYRRHERDELIREAVKSGLITKYALAQRLGLTKQAIQRIAAA